ncbi:ABC transporter substrate-binding protein [Shewanella sp. 202IG2-18]|uniref:MlaC/ttg2D family ABC transporter substrate-binding protein n=1 Tax=Parashewanella hymeniacidonis TaxID=2807618 RepID=UPI0019603F76|nr:ABC transporter substrate-binding protein [Parashewanella hymeniacidonis]MBM7072249.1 ABC transporter substrate-binding protein [Parashewanella hymeniacidonis]
MFKLFSKVFTVVLLCFTANTVYAAIDVSNPYTMIEQVAKKTFDRFDADQAKIKANPNYLKTVITEELLPHVDYKYASLKVLGSNARQLSQTIKPRDKFIAKLNEFTDSFKGYMVSTYASAFTEYSHQKVEFPPAKKLTDSKFVTVPVRVIEPGRPPIKLAFKVRRQKDNTWKVYDLVAEGVSLIQSKQSEIGGLIQREGIDNVIKMLDKKATADVSKKSEK